MDRSGTFLLAAVLAAAAAPAQEWIAPGWRMVMLPAPNTGREQTSAAVFDIDGDRVNDIVITERTAAPGVIGYLRRAGGWTRFVIDPELVRVEAGSAFADIDLDGDLDFAAGGESRSNEVWWWENPAPDVERAGGWTRRALKRTGERKHHDLLFAGTDGDHRPELFFWNQGARQLLRAPIPFGPRHAGEWPRTVLYEYSGDSQPAQRATSPAWRKVNEHEGLAAADINRDGRLDIIAGGHWFQAQPDHRWTAHPIDPAYPFSRAAAGQWIEGGRPEVVLVAGDGAGPLILYEWRAGTWTPRTLIERVVDGHSLAAADFDGDGRLDIFCAEMRVNGGNPEAKAWILYGDGQGNFRTEVVLRGFDLHEAKVADLDGDGRLDILAKPYNHQAPALRVFLRAGQ